MERSEQRNRADAWSLSDGRAGNVRQAAALCAALGLAAQPWTLQARAPWRWLAPRRLPGASSAFGADFAHALREPPALAIGCGRQAALATRLLRARGSRVVQVLDPRLPPSHWDLVVAPEHDRLRGRNVITLLGSLNPVDDAWLARARAGAASLASLPRPRIAMLLGGPTGHARYDVAAAERWVAQVAATAAREGGSLLLCASPRTPATLRAALRAQAVPAAGLRWLDPADGNNPYAGVLAWADRIACSPDSVNMLSEACATRAPVHVAAPALARGRLRAFLDALQARGRIRALDMQLGRFEVEPLRETARVASEVCLRLGL